MPADVTREEFQARADVLEREVEGEKLVTRHILEQTRRNSDDLATIRARVDRIESRLESVESRLGQFEQKIDSLAASLPRVIGEVMREVLRERDGSLAQLSDEHIARKIG
jgi:seryl-tRNA synthetase